MAALGIWSGLVWPRQTESINKRVKRSDILRPGGRVWLTQFTVQPLPHLIPKCQQYFQKWPQHKTNAEFNYSRKAKMECGSVSRQMDSMTPSLSLSLCCPVSESSTHTRTQTRISTNVLTAKFLNNQSCCQPSVWRLNHARHASHCALSAVKGWRPLR